MPLTGTVNAANARIDLFVDWVATAGTQTSGSLLRRVGSPTAENQYVRALFGSALLGEQAYVSDHEAPLDEQIWYVAVNNQTSDTMTAGPFTIPSSGYVWMKDPGRPWADLRLDLCVSPDTSAADDSCASLPAVSDTFTRTLASLWGPVERGGQTWLNSSGVAADYNVSGGQGRHLMSSTTSRRSTIVPAQADYEQLADIGVTQTATGSPIYGALMARVVDGNTMYMARLEFLTTGALTLGIRERTAGVETSLATYATLLTYAPNAMFTVRFQIRGNTLRARVWPAGTAEPTVWHVVATDASLALAGTAGPRSQLETAPANTNVNASVLYDNYTLDYITVTDDLAWVGYRDKVRGADAGLFPVLDRERPADVYARRKDIVTSCLFLTRSLSAIDAVYELYTAGGPLLFQTPDIYGMSSQYGYKDRYFQPGDLNEAYISQDQRKPLRLWSAPLTAVDLPVGLPQGTDNANWCAIEDQYPTFAQLTATGLTWAQIAQGQAVTLPFAGLYEGGMYTDEGA